MAKKRTDLVMSFFRNHIADDNGMVVNLPKAPFGFMPFVRQRFDSDGEDLLEKSYEEKKEALGIVFAELISKPYVDDEIISFRLLVNIDTISLREAQDIRDCVFERLKMHVIKRRIVGSRGWRAGAVRRGSLKDNGYSYTYSTDIVLSNKVWYNEDQNKVVTFDDAEFQQLEKAVLLGRDESGHDSKVRIKVKQMIDLKRGTAGNARLKTEFA